MTKIKQKIVTVKKKVKCEEPGSVVIRVMTDDNGVITGSPSENTTITDMMLDVANDCSFWDRSNRQHISDHQSSLLAAVHKLASVHAFSGNEKLFLFHVAEGMAENDSGQRSAATGIMNDLGDDTLEITVALAEVEAAELGRAFAVMGMGFEDGTCTLTLSANHTTHCS